ncbi:hypothetical protein ABPG72_004512 [Tetrahymena utriculariae]
MKIQDDSFEQSPQSYSKPISKTQVGTKNNRKYNKITHDLRMKFLDKIFFENKSIKKAAQELNINYSSAKTILNLHRKKQRFQLQAPASISDISSEIDQTKICGFSTQTLFKKQKLELVVTLGGRLMNSNKIDPSTINNPFILQNNEKLVVSQPVSLYKTVPITPEELFLQQQQQQQHSQQQQQQLLIKLLQEQQLQEQQRLQQQQQLQQQLALNPELYSLFLEKQKQQDQQQQLIIAQLLQQQQQKNQAFGLF